MTAALRQRDAADGSVAGCLAAQGYVIMRGLLPPAVLARLDADLAPAFAATPFSQGPFYGRGTIRFGRLLARSAVMADLVLHPEVRAAADVLLHWHENIQLDFTQAIAVAPGARAQVPHRDGEMWPLQGVPGEHLVNAIWPLTSFTLEAGATQLWANSHRGAREPMAEAPLTAIMEPGDVLIFLGSTLHRQGVNVSGETRRAVVTGYSAAWLKPSENQVLSYPPALARGFSAELADLIGYRRMAPNLNNYDCRCPSELLRGDMGIGAIDQLRADQLATLERRFGADA